MQEKRARQAVPIAVSTRTAIKMRQPLSVFWLVLHCIGSSRRRDAERFEKSTKTCIVVQRKINVLQPTQPKRNLTIAMFDRENSFALSQRKGDLVHHVGGLHCCGRKNHQQLGTLCQSVLNGTVPALTGLYVELVYPHVRTART